MLVALSQPRHEPWLTWAALGAGALLAISLAFAGRRSDWAVGLGLLGLVGAVYAGTLSPTTDIGDSLEWVIVARDLGIGHGPGYPLYVLLGHLIQQLPLADLAWRMNLLSALAGTLAVAMTYLIAWQLTGRRSAALAGALLFAFSTAFWSLALITEVYTLQVLLFALVLYCLLRWTDAARQASGSGWLVASAFCLGLAMVQHLANWFLLPVVLLVVAWNAPRRRDQLRSLGLAGLAFLAGLLPLAYFPLRWPAVYGRNVGAGELSRYLLASDYRRLFFPERLAADPSRLWMYRHELGEQFPWLALAVILCGIPWLWGRRRQWLLWLGLLWAMFTLARLAYYAWDGWVIQTPAHLLLALFFAAGLAGVAEWLTGAGRLPTPWANGLAAALGALLVTVALWEHGPRVDMRAGWPGMAVVQRSLAQDLPAGAWILTDPDLGSGLVYDAWVRGQRPDLKLDYADTREGRNLRADPAQATGPLYVLGTSAPEGPDVYLRSRGPLVEVGRRPWRALPPEFQPIDSPSAPIRLAGYRVEGEASGPLLPGEPRGITLVWQAPADAEDLLVSLALTDAAGHRAATTPARPVGGRRAFDTWQAGEYVADFHELPVDWSLPAGDYALTAQLSAPDGSLRGPALPVADFTLAPGDVTKVQPELPLRVDWPDSLSLLGCDGCVAVRPGEPVPIRLYWQVPPAPLPGTMTVTLDGLAADLSTVRLPALPPGAVFATDHRLDLPAQYAARTWSPRVSLARAGRPVPRRVAGGLWTSALPYPLPQQTVLPKSTGVAEPFRFADGLRLAGVQAPPIVQAGERLWVGLDWEADAAPSGRYTAFVHLLDAANRRLAGIDREILHAARPTSSWRPGDRVHDRMPLDLPADLPPGPYQLLVGLYDQSSKAPLPAVDSGGRAIDRRALVPLWLPDPDPAPLDQALAARFAAGVDLAGASVGQNGSGQSGRPLPVRLRWRVRSTPAQKLTLFAHLVRAGSLVAQDDRAPFDGVFPTTAWPADQLIDTDLALAVPPGVTPGNYELHVGLYDAATGQRALLSDNSPGAPADHVVLPVIIR
jgi:hypothetical protein